MSALPFKCPTCGHPVAELGECSTCARDWQRARRSPGFLPTLSLDLPDGEPLNNREASTANGLAAARPSQLDAFTLDLFTEGA